MKKEVKNKRKKEYLYITILILLIILIDQISKILVLNLENPVTIGILELRINSVDSGVAEDTSKMMNIIVNVIALIIIFRIITSNNLFINLKIKLLLSLAFAGGLSNIIDKIFRGNIVEYINNTSWSTFPAFNIADICILIGWISFVAVFASFSANEWKAKRTKGKTD